MRPFNDLTYLGQLRRLRAMALDALERYAIRVQRVRAINHGENATFKVVADEGHYLLRIHRADYNTPEAIGVEFAWLDAIAQDGRVVAPRPIAASDGSVLQAVTHAGVPGTRSVALLAWVDGAFRCDSLSPRLLHGVGRMTAHVHELGTRIDPALVTQRPRWDANGLLGDDAVWGALGDLPSLDTDGRKGFYDVRADLRERLRDYDPGPARSGLIHADLHHWNYLFDGPHPRPIDFDDCGWGFHLYDLAVTGVAITRHRHRDALRAALLEGYSEVRPLTTDDAETVRVLRAARRVAITGWIASRADNPRIAAHVPNVTKAHAAGLREFVDGAG